MSCPHAEAKEATSQAMPLGNSSISNKILCGTKCEMLTLLIGRVDELQEGVLDSQAHRCSPEKLWTTTRKRGEGQAGV